MVLEQLVSSCPRETICHPPLCVLHWPKAPSRIQTLIHGNVMLDTSTHTNIDVK